MKRIILIGLVAVAALTVCVHAAASTTTDKKATPSDVVTTAEATQASRITEDDAKRIALDRVGLKEKDVTFLNAKLDYDDGQYYYDVEFYHDIDEYDFEIDAYTGKVLEFDYDVENYELERTPATEAPATEAPVQATEPAPAPKSNSGGISEGQAKKVALSHAGVSEGNVAYIYVKRDYDDGYSVYDVEFQAGTTEYEYEIDANSGTIIEFDAESIYDD